jgi:transcriptional regulator with XRE-family HTH domain
MKNFFSIGIFCLLFSAEATSPSDNRISSTYADEAPKIDGILDDAIWSKAQSVTNFKTFVPDFSKDMEHKTIAYWSHDEDNLYFAFKCFDDPDMIKTSLAARDKIRDDDWVCVNLDSFNDRQTLYGFYVNPNGIQMDSRFAGGRDDNGVDMIWYSAGKIDEDGYTVEMKIPFKSIRYAVNEGQVDMGIIFERKISRLSTQGTFPALDPKQGFNLLNQTMPLRYDGVKKTVLLELLPAFTYGRSRYEDGGEKISVDNPELSLTAKYGITSDLVLDATYNPDFSQVEADAVQVQVNQRFPVFFQEKRPFFLEGSENFNHAGGSGRSEIRKIVNTRSIVNPITAGKITGKIGGNKNTVSAIAAIDKLPDTTFNANVGVLRYKRAFKKDSYLGGFWTNRSEGGFTNMVYGTDGQFRIGDASLLSGYFFNSNTRFTENTKMDSRHATSLNYSFRNRKVSIGGGILDIAPNFQSAVGYVTRTGISKANVFFNPKFYPDKSVVQRIDPLVYISVTRDKPSGLYERSIYSRVSASLPRSTRISVTGSVSNEVYEAQLFNRGSIGLDASSQLNKRVYVKAGYRVQNRPYYSSLEQGEGKSVSGSLILQASDNFNAEINYSFSDLNSTETDERFYNIHIIRSKNTYQLNKYLFVRAIIQYDSFNQVLTPNLLASFTYIPGTVVHLGWGGYYDKTSWNSEAGDYVDSPSFVEKSQGLFFKASYLWRL